MRISDWSSDVCSSDLETLPLPIGEWQWNAIGKVARLSCVRIANDIDGFDQCRPCSRRLEGEGVQKCRSEEHTSELQSLMRISYAVFCLKKKRKHKLSQKLRSQNVIEMSEMENITNIIFNTHIRL